MEEGFNVKKNNKRAKSTSLVTLAVGAVVVGAGGFIGGMQFQKSTGSNSSVSAQQQAGRMGGQGMDMGRGAFGTVSAVDGTSITVKDDRQGGSTTLTINSATTVTDDGSTAKVSDIKVGDRVMIETDTTDTKRATQIRLNPTMPGGANGNMMQPGNNTQTN